MSRVAVAACAAAAVIPLAVVSPAAAEPTTTPEVDVDKPAASIPMPVPHGAIGYVATRDATRWLADRKPDAVIANLPVPPSFRKANGAMADHLGRELDTAMETPGACLQIIVNPRTDDGGLFNYGFFAVEQQYCPK